MKNLTLYIIMTLAVIGCQSESNPHPEISPQPNLPSASSVKPNTVLPPSQQQDYKKPSYPLAKRKLLRDRFLAAAAYVVNKTGDKEAQQILNFLNDFQRLAEPMGSPNSEDWAVMIPMEEAREPFDFMLVPVTSSDVELGGLWKNLVDPKPEQGMAFASFHPDYRLMTVRFDQEVNKYVLGLYALHEGRHARDYIPTPYDWQDDQIFCQKEVGAHEFQNRLMAKMGGKRYDTLVLSEARQMVDTLKAKGQLGKVWPSPKYYPIVFKIFGQPKSLLEKNAVCTSVWIDIVFQVINNTVQDPIAASEEKSKFLYSFYRHKKMLGD